MTGVSGVMVGTGRGPGAEAGGGGRGQEAGAGGGRHLGRDQEVEGQGAGVEGVEGQGATVEGAIPEAGARTPSQAETRDPSQGAGAEQRGLLTAYIETGLLTTLKQPYISLLCDLDQLKTPLPPLRKDIVLCET